MYRNEREDEFPLVVDEARDIEALGAAPGSTAAVGAAWGGFGVGLLFELGGWMYYGRDALSPLPLAAIGAALAAGVLFAVFLADSARRRGESFSFWPDRFERSGSGGTWLVRYGEIGTVTFVSRARLDIVTREGQPRSIRHMVFSFMQRFQQVGAPAMALRLRQQELESGRSVVLREPMSVPALALVWLLRMLVLGSIVWYCMALFLTREGAPRPFETQPALVTGGVAAVVLLLVARFGARRTVLTSEKVSQPGASIAWADVERLTCDMDTIEIRSRTKGAAPVRVSWHAANAFVLPFIVEGLVKDGVRVDTSEWASPWQLMGHDPVSLAPPDFD